MPIRRRCFLLSLLPAVFAAGWRQNPSVEFIHLTDTHVVDLSGVAEPLASARSHFRGSGAALSAFLSGDRRPAAASFALITGDLIDAFSFAAPDGGRVYGQIAAFERATRGSRIPLYLLLGNHDIQHYAAGATGKPAADHSVAGQARAAWIGAVPSSFEKGTYYSVEKQAGGTRYVILMLDNGYSAAGSPDGAGLRMAHEQAYWIRRQAELHRGAVIILAMHIPLGADSASQAVKAAVSGSRSPVLVLAGHNHKDGIEDIALGETAGVQVRTAAFGYGTNNWRRIRLAPGRVEVFATGRPDQIERTIGLARQPAH